VGVIAGVIAGVRRRSASTVAIVLRGEPCVYSMR